MADITVKKNSPGLFLLWWSAEQGQWKTERSKVWHSNLIPTLIGLLGASCLQLAKLQKLPHNICLSRLSRRSCK